MCVRACVCVCVCVRACVCVWRMKLCFNSNPKCFAISDNSSSFHQLHLYKCKQHIAVTQCSMQRSRSDIANRNCSLVGGLVTHIYTPNQHCLHRLSHYMHTSSSGSCLPISSGQVERSDANLVLNVHTRSLPEEIPHTVCCTSAEGRYPTQSAHQC